MTPSQTTDEQTPTLWFVVGAQGQNARSTRRRFGVNVGEIHLFDSSTERQPLAAGTLLFDADDTGDAMYAVISGEIDIVIDGSTVETVSAGGILGELALVDDGPRAGAAIARSDAVVVPVARQRFIDLIERHPTFALQVMAVMADRLRNEPAPSA